jgi:hypothetical protein
MDFLSDINKGYEEVMEYGRIDLFMIKVIWAHFAVILFYAFTTSFVKLSTLYESPFAYRVIPYNEAIGAVLIGLLAVLLPTLLRGKIQNHYVWRILITVTLTVYSYILVFLSGGSIEMHFHFFIIIALICFYSDWRLGWFVLVLTALHHGILNYIAPDWVYFYGRNDFSVIAHGLPVLVAVFFTTLLCESNRRVIILVTLALKKLEDGKKIVTTIMK